MNSSVDKDPVYQWGAAIVVFGILLLPACLLVMAYWRLHLSTRGLVESALLAIPITGAMIYSSRRFVRRLVAQGRHPKWNRFEDIQIERPLLSIVGLYFFASCYAPAGYMTWLRLTAEPMTSTFTVAERRHCTRISCGGCRERFTTEEWDSLTTSRFCADDLPAPPVAGSKVQIRSVRNSRALYVLDIQPQPD